jgi:hypothetical protein
MPKVGDIPRLHNGFRANLSAQDLDVSLYTYAISDGWAIKIGMSLGHPQKRLHDLQTGNSRELQLLAYTNGVEISGSVKDNSEARVHQRLARYSLRGEWFALCPQVLAEVRRWDWLDVGLHQQLVKDSQTLWVDTGVASCP